MRRILRIAAAVLGGLVTLTLLGVVGADWGIDTYAASAIEERGMRCDPVDVSFAMDLSSASIGPTRCRPDDAGRLRLLRVTFFSVAGNTGLSPRLRVKFVQPDQPLFSDLRINVRLTFQYPRASR